MSWLDRIREKPESARARYLFAAVGASFLFVLVVWFFSLKTSVLGISDIGSNEGFESIRQFREDVGSPPSLDGLLKSGESLQGTKPASGEGVLPSGSDQAGTVDAPSEQKDVPSEGVPIDSEGGY